MKKPISLDSAEITAINTRIACNGIDKAEAGYRAWCREAGLPMDNWVVNYIRLYARYAKKRNALDNFIDVKAATRALREACDCAAGCIECQGPDLEDFR